MMLRPDGEPALVAVAEKVKSKREEPTVVHPPPEESPQSTGGAENQHKQTFGKLRTHRAALELRLNEKIGPKHKLMPWLVRHMPWCRNKFQVGKDGRTAHRRTYGKDYTHGTLQFGEICIGKLKAKQLKDAKLDKRGIRGV